LYTVGGITYGEQVDRYSSCSDTWFTYCIIHFTPVLHYNIYQLKKYMNVDAEHNAENPTW